MFKPKVLIYIRVSTEEQAKFGYSINMQQNQCTTYADKMGFDIGEIYIDDGYTAKNMKRPQLLRMLDIVKKRKDIYAVIVWRIDRLCRNNDDYHETFRPILEKRGVQLLSVTENNDVDNPYGRYMRNLQINNAELESNLTSIRTIANLKEKAKQGYFPGAKPPVGYKRIVKDSKKIIVIDEDTAPMVKHILTKYSTGLYTYAQIASEMRKRNFIHNRRPCSKKLIENIVSNNLIFYTGKFVFSGETYQGRHEPLINKETYLKILKIKEKNKNKIQRHEFLYRGLLKCPTGEKMLTGEIQKGANKSGEYIYYRCHRKCEHYDNCKLIVKESVIDDAVEQAIKSITFTKEDYIKLKDDIKRLLHIQTEFDEAAKKNLEKQIRKLRDRITNLYEDKLDGVISNETYFQKKQEWEVLLDEKTMEYAALSKTNQDLIKKIEKMFELSKDLWGNYCRHTMDEKRLLLNLLCSNFFYNGSKAIITIKEPFRALYKFAFSVNGAGDGIRTHAYRNHNPRP